MADWRSVVRRKTCSLPLYSSHVRNFSCSAWNSRTTSPCRRQGVGSGKTKTLPEANTTCLRCRRSWLGPARSCQSQQAEGEVHAEPYPPEGSQTPQPGTVPTALGQTPNSETLDSGGETCCYPEPPPAFHVGTCPWSPPSPDCLSRNPARPLTANRKSHRRDRLGPFCLLIYHSHSFCSPLDWSSQSAGMVTCSSP